MGCFERFDRDLKYGLWLWLVFGGTKSESFGLEKIGKLWVWPASNICIGDTTLLVHSDVTHHRTELSVSLLSHSFLTVMQVHRRYRD